MSVAALQLQEKHDGALRGSTSRHDAVRLWLRMLSCTMIIEKRIKRGLADQFATTLPRFDILAALDRADDGLIMGALGRALLVSNGNIIGLVQTPIRAGDVEMTPAPGGRRAAIVTLTPDGRARFAAMATANHAWVAAMFAAVPDADRGAMFDLLGDLKASIAVYEPETAS